MCFEISEPALFLPTCPASPLGKYFAHSLLTHVRPCITPGDCAAGWVHACMQASRKIRELWGSGRAASWQWRAQPWSCMDAAPGCRFLAEALLNQHIDGVARAGSAGTKSGSSARSLVLLTMLAPVVENRTVQGSATARRRSELGNRPLRCHRQPGCRWHLSRRFASFQRQCGPADPSESVFGANAPRIHGTALRLPRTLELSVYPLSVSISIKLVSPVLGVMCRVTRRAERRLRRPPPPRAPRAGRRACAGRVCSR